MAGVGEKSRGKTESVYPRQESNLDYQLRRLVRYPLHHGGMLKSKHIQHTPKSQHKSRSPVFRLMPDDSLNRFAAFLIK